MTHTKGTWAFLLDSPFQAPLPYTLALSGGVHVPWWFHHFLCLLCPAQPHEGSSASPLFSHGFFPYHRFLHDKSSPEFLYYRKKLAEMWKKGQDAEGTFYGKGVKGKKAVLPPWFGLTHRLLYMLMQAYVSILGLQYLISGKPLIGYKEVNIFFPIIWDSDFLKCS